MPFKRGIDTLGTEVIFDSGDYKRLLNNALEKLNFPNFRKSLNHEEKWRACRFWFWVFH